MHMYIRFLLDSLDFVFLHQIALVGIIKRWPRPLPYYEGTFLALSYIIFILESTEICGPC